jgi:flagellar biosynthesis anti-sigma factor FlgM
MRIDGLNRTPIAQRAEKSGAAAPHDENVATGSDHAEISQLAQALANANPDRIEQLRQQVQSGTYDISAETVAAALITAHLKE